MNGSIIAEIESARLLEPLNTFSLGREDCEFYDDETCMADGDGYFCEEKHLCWFKMRED